MLFIAGLLGGVTLGYLYAVEGGRGGRRGALRVRTRHAHADAAGPARGAARHDGHHRRALRVAGGGKRVHASSSRAYGTDRWIAETLAGLGWGPFPVLLTVLCILALCALVLDAFEMIFVVVPVVMPPLLTAVHNVTWVAVLTLLILQASFLCRHSAMPCSWCATACERPLRMDRLRSALLPYLVAQLCVLALVLAVPRLVGNEIRSISISGGGPAKSEIEGREMLERQLDEQLQARPPDNEPANEAPDSGAAK